MKNEFNLESIIFSYIEQFKFLLFPDQWSIMFLDYSKNEVLALIYLYRYRTSNMTDIAEFINAPLNTATGVINRLEKKEMVERIRSKEDRRIVQLTLTDRALDFLSKQKTVIEDYMKKINDSLTDEEKTAAFNILSKVTDILKNSKKTSSSDNTKKIRKIEIE